MSSRRRVITSIQPPTVIRDRWVISWGLSIYSLSMESSLCLCFFSIFFLFFGEGAGWLFYWILILVHNSKSMLIVHRRNVFTGSTTSQESSGSLTKFSHLGGPGFNLFFFFCFAFVQFWSNSEPHLPTKYFVKKDTRKKCFTSIKDIAIWQEFRFTFGRLCSQKITWWEN